jgi:serine/threonine-protein kinase
VRRPSSASELLAALDDVATSQTAPPPPPTARNRRNLTSAIVAVVIALAAAGLWWLQSRAESPAATHDKSIAVLPFESVGGDTANVYFAEGMADELTTALAGVQGLRVAATSSAFTYRGKTVDPREVGKALNVGAVLQGRVRRAGAVLRVSAQLTNSVDGLVLWSRSFDRDARDVFAVQDDLTREIVRALKITLVGGEPASAGQGTRDIEAHDLYLRGLYLLNRRGPGVRQSIAYFQKAIARDSTFTRAWAQLGTAYGLLPIFDPVVLDTELRSARFAIDHALQLDSLSAEAHAASGLVLAMTGKWNAAEAAYRRAIDLDPNYVVTYRLALSTFAVLGREADALTAVRVLMERDPLSATSGAVIALTQLSFGHRDDALASANRAMELDSMTAMSRAMLAMTQLAAGQTDVARELANRSIHTPNTTPWIGWVFGSTGDRTAAAALTREMEQQRGRNASADLTIAFIALGARDTTRALEYLERSARAREAVSYMAPFGLPAYDAIRQSARFAAVIRAFGADPTPFIRATAARQ